MSSRFKKLSISKDLIFPIFGDTKDIESDSELSRSEFIRKIVIPYQELYALVRSVDIELAITILKTLTVVVEYFNDIELPVEDRYVFTDTLKRVIKITETDLTDPHSTDPIDIKYGTGVSFSLPILDRGLYITPILIHIIKH